jgi:hypothetical protein
VGEEGWPTPADGMRMPPSPQAQKGILASPRKRLGADLPRLKEGGGGVDAIRTVWNVK